MWVLVIERRSFERAGSALNLWAISPAQETHFLNYMYSSIEFGCGCGCVHATLHVWRSEVNFPEGPEDRNQAVNLGSNFPYLLNHLASPQETKKEAGWFEDKLHREFRASLWYTWWDSTQKSTWKNEWIQLHYKHIYELWGNCLFQSTKFRQVILHFILSQNPEDILYV